MQQESPDSSAALASVDDEAVRNDYPWGTNPQVVTAIQRRFSTPARLAGKHSEPNVSLAGQNQRLIFGPTVSLSQRGRLPGETF